MLKHITRHTIILYVICPSICAHMHEYMHTYIHMYMHAYIHTYIHACISTYIHKYIHTYTHTCTHTYTHTYTYTYTNIHTYITERLKENTTEILYYSGVTQQATYAVSIRRPFTNQIVIWRKEVLKIITALQKGTLNLQHSVWSLRGRRSTTLIWFWRCLATASVEIS